MSRIEGESRSLDTRRPEGASIQTWASGGGVSRWRYESRVRDGREASIGCGKQGKRRYKNDVDTGSWYFVCGNRIVRRA